MQQTAQHDLGFIEQMMYTEIRSAAPEQQAELRALAAAQSLAEFTQTLKQRFAQQARYITEERVAAVLAYDREHQAQNPAPAPVPTSQPGSTRKQDVSPAAPAPVPQKAKVAREEMWFVIAAKSKTMRFFAVSCEFIIFLGCLWLTLVTILPAATGWFNGGIDNFFLIAMGFAVDAALPEAWLHVVDQFTHTPRKKTQLAWSIPIAIGMLVLVVANFVYAKVVGTSGQAPAGALAILVNTLLIARMFIGISYVTIRECQSFLDRKQAKQQASQQPHDEPHMQPEAIEQRIAEATQNLQAQFEQRLEEITGNQARNITNVQTTIEQRLTVITGDQARLLASIDQVKQQTAIAPEVNFEDIIRAIMPQLRATFQSQARTIVEEIQSQAGPEPQRQLEARARSQSHYSEPPFQSQGQKSGPPNLTLLGKSKPAPAPSANANGTPEKRLEAAYDKLVEEKQRISGRTLAALAHVNRGTATKWLGEVKGQSDSEPEPCIESTCEVVEAIAQGQ